MTPQRIRLSRAAGWRIPEGTVNVARPGPLGNPVVVGKDGDRAECVRLHKALLAGYACVSGPATMEEQRAHRDYVLAHRDELRGRDVACWCRGEPCHGDTLLAVFNGVVSP